MRGGAPETDPLSDAEAMVFERECFAGSSIGGIAEARRVTFHCVARNIETEVVLIDVQNIDRACKRGGKRRSEIGS